MTIPKIKITNEEDAWKALEEALKEEEHLYPVDFTFDNWPKIDIKLDGSLYQSSLTSQSMEGLIEFQKHINRVYAQICYEGPPTKLKNEDKKELEIIYKITEGSTEVSVDFTQAAVRMAEGLVTKMSGTEMTITILGLAIIGACAYGFKNYITRQQQDKIADALISQNKEETKRTELLTKAMSRVPVLKEVQEEADETYNKVLRGVQETDTLTIDGQIYEHEEIKSIVRTPRSKSIEAQLNGNYRVEKIDNSTDGEFNVFVTNKKNELSFNARLEDVFLHRKEEYKKLLSTAIIERTNIYLKINAKIIREQVVSATIVGVEQEKTTDLQ